MAKQTQWNNFPKKFLKHLYNDIKEHPIEWDKDEVKTEKKENVPQEIHDERYLKEQRIKQRRKRNAATRAMVREVQVWLRTLTPYAQSLFPVNDGDIIKPMMESTFKDFEEAITSCGITQNTDTLNVCIDGFKAMKTISHELKLEIKDNVENALKFHEDILELQWLKAAIMNIHTGLLKKNYKNLKPYPNTLIASKLVEWLLKEKKADSEEKAVAIGNALKRCGLVCAIPGKGDKFENNKLLYHFVDSSSNMN